MKCLQLLIPCQCLLVFSPCELSLPLHTEIYEQVRLVDDLKTNKTHFHIIQCQLNALECQLLLGPVFDSVEPLLAVVCLAIT